MYKYGYRTNDNKNEYHHLGEHEKFSWAMDALWHWAHEEFGNGYPEHLLYITEEVNGEIVRSLNLEEWDQESISADSY